MNKSTLKIPDHLGKIPLPSSESGSLEALSKWIRGVQDYYGRTSTRPAETDVAIAISKAIDAHIGLVTHDTSAATVYAWLDRARGLLGQPSHTLNNTLSERARDRTSMLDYPPECTKAVAAFLINHDPRSGRAGANPEEITAKEQLLDPQLKIRISVANAKAGRGFSVLYALAPSVLSDPLVHVKDDLDTTFIPSTQSFAEREPIRCLCAGGE